MRLCSHLLIAGTLLALSGPASAMEFVTPHRQPTVVELFTSQGCSSCPPANANLIKLAARPDVLALSFSVTYWDYLGWKDVFGQPAYTQRQAVYEPRLGEAGPFTPQMVVDGRASAIGYDLREMQALIEASPPKSGPAISLGRERVDLGAGRPGRTGSDVWLVWFDPATVEVPVRRGENTGRTLPHSHVVHHLARLGGWNGEAVAFSTPATPKGLKTAILVQEPGGGPILAAATD
ncbi:DUF1223 domain-containing protein [Ancylobacter dichloromethanicus]|uniref:DUF1223 domain-containing protein n=2 Tax=Ancylobacter dichloromethanicus TaxID=518825 RepID=A0A9W6JAK8_9HYPH|nr:DUF1223 domain-containing protein [Ancylobacter dichloromethanicus]GLK72320.1 hypothetical protein GCM10017643_24360 [Ancylobacter dichloromethanicus]